MDAKERKKRQDAARKKANDDLAKCIKNGTADKRKW